MDLEEHAGHLLELLADHAAGGGNYLVLEGWVTEHGLSDDDGDRLADFLEARGLAKVIRTLGGSSCEITAEGIHVVQQHRRKLADPAFRAAELRRRMLLWLDAEEEAGRTVASWDGFTNSEHAQYGDTVFSQRELQHAGEYLVHHQLITDISSWGSARGMTRPQLTVNGRTCITDFGGHVTDYLNSRQGGITNNTTWNVDNKGNFAVDSQHVSQTTNTGLQIADVLKLAGGVVQMSSVLQLPAEAERELVAQAEELHALASSAQPDRSRLRQLIDGIGATLKSAAPTVASATLIDLAKKAIEAISS